MPDKIDYFWLFFQLKGRVSRAAYFLAGTLVWMVQIFLLYRFALEPEGSAASQTLALAFAASAIVGGWAHFALTAKRFHDFGKPAYFAIVAFFIGFILLIALSLVRGDPGPNRYGSRTNAPG